MSESTSGDCQDVSLFCFVSLSNGSIEWNVLGDAAGVVSTRFFLLCFLKT